MEPRLGAAMQRASPYLRISTRASTHARSACTARLRPCLLRSAVRPGDFDACVRSPEEFERLMIEDMGVLLVLSAWHPQLALPILWQLRQNGL